MKKSLLALIAILIMNFSTANAVEVQAVGHGETEQMAIHNAMRNAIEQETGVLIDSKVIVQNRQVINSEIYSKSIGFIKGYEILRKTIVNGIIEVAIKADVLSDELNTKIMSAIQKQSIIETNMNDPRIAIIALDAYGQRYEEIESEIINALQVQGFKRIVDINQLNNSMIMRMKNAANDKLLLQAIQNQFHVDYLVVVQVKVSQTKSSANATLATRMISVNTGEILYAGTNYGKSRMFTNNTVEDVIRSATKGTALAVSNAALKYSAKVEQHSTILITKNTLNKFDGNIDKLIERIKNIQGINNVFVRSFNDNMAEIDVNFDGTTSELATKLEYANIHVIEMYSEYIKI